MAQPRQRHLGLCGGALGAGRSRGALQQGLHQLVFVQTADRKAFVVPLRRRVVAKGHQQALAEEGFDRFAQKLGELLQRERHGGVGRERSQCRQALAAIRPVGASRLVHGAPFAGVCEQGAVGLKVAAAKGLQRVLGGAAAHYRIAPARAQVVAQLGYQHRGGLLGVVAHIAPAPADIQQAPRGEQRFEHKLAVVVAPGPVAGAGGAGQGHQVKVAVRAAPGVVAVVHAQQADHLKRNGAHGHQGAKGNAPGAKALLGLGQFQRLQPGGARDCQRNALRKPGLFASALPGQQAALQGGQRQAVFLGLGLQQVGQQRLAVLYPLGGRGVYGGQRPPARQRLQQVGQRPGQFGLQAAHFGVGRNRAQFGQRGVYCIGATGVAQQHAAQAKPGAVLFAAGAQA